MLHGKNSFDAPQYLCNRCGRDCRDTDEYPTSSTDEYANPLEGTFRLHGCYGSTRYDLSLQLADLCEDCCVELIQWIGAGRTVEGKVQQGPGIQSIDVLAADGEFCKDPSEVLRGHKAERQQQWQEQWQEFQADKYKTTP